MSNSLFRQEALDRIESPERLNEMIKITSPRNWIVLVSVFGIILSVIAWSIFGELPYTVQGQGIILQIGGVQEVASISSGKVKGSFVVEGDEVNEGDLLAIVEQPELKLRIENEKDKLNNFVTRFLRIKDFGSESTQRKKDLYMKEINILNNSIKNNKEKIDFIIEKIDAQNELLKKGLITSETLHNTKTEYFKVQIEVDGLENELGNIFNKVYEIMEVNEIEVQRLQSEILQIENNIKELNALYSLKSFVYSPFNGKVIEIMVNPGTIVNERSPILSIEPRDISKKLETIIYVNPMEGKRIEEGMSAKIQPSTIEVEEYGYIIGKVTKVAEYPSTHQGMLRTLNNEQLVRTFLSEGPPIAITVIPEHDSTTYSGFKWSTIFGPQQDIRSGTLCIAKITVDSKRPISLLIPQKARKPLNFLRQKLNSYKASESNKRNLTTEPQIQINESVDTKLDSVSESELKLQQQDLNSYYTIQILATRSPANPRELNSLNKSDLDVISRYVDGWYKYSIGKFNTYEEAKFFINQNKKLSNCFITLVKQ